jgi:hypothetical protein
LRRFYRVTSFSRYLLVEIILYKNQDGVFFLWHLVLWILSIQPSHYYTLAYCRPIFLISIEFKISKHWQRSGLPTKKTFSSPPIIIILQSMRSLWLRFFLQTVSIVRYKILRLVVEKHHFILIIAPHDNKYIFQAQYSPKRPWNFRG